jgi:hypothetical protein
MIRLTRSVLAGFFMYLVKQTILAGGLTAAMQRYNARWKLRALRKKESYGHRILYLHNYPVFVIVTDMSVVWILS